MSSATSIDPVSAEGAAGAAAREERQPRDVFKPWHFFVLVSLLAATVAVTMAREARPEHLVVVSLTIGAAGFAAGALYRTLVPLVSRDVQALNEPLTENLRAVLERDKALVLRSIKELEFDRSMGKVSPKDFDEMAGRLRGRAIAIMRQLDSGSAYRELIERELRARVRRPAPAPRVKSAPARELCACGTANDPDAAFCKRCGARLAPSTAS